MTKKLLLFTLVAAAFVAFFALGLHRYFTLSSMQEHFGALQQFYVDHPTQALGLYFILYVVMAALSFPGAVPLTLLGGALFGFTVGTIVVSFGSTVGATLTFLLVRYLLADWVREKYGDKMRKVDEGFEQEGAFYLFALRLVPIFPFFLINLLMALTPIRALTFYWVSQLGMLPGTMVFVYAGLQLGQIESVSDIFTLDIALAFAAIGLLPLLAKKGLRLWRTRQQQTVAD